MPKKKDLLLYGTLDLLILRLLAVEEMHGFGIAQRIHILSEKDLHVGEGSLYPALHRLEFKKWITANWKVSEHNRQAKFYSLTTSGRKQLRENQDDWNRLSTAVEKILRAVPET